MLKVGKITEGTVIDHIPAGKALKCLYLINPNGTKNTIIAAINVPSTKYGKKDILKLENTFPTKDVLDRIALIAPNATVNVIKNEEVVEKRSVEFPKEINGGLKCINPKCATKSEKYLVSKFFVESMDPLKIRCKYCDRAITEHELMEQLGK